MPRKPNLLFIFTDQQRADTLACYGNDWIQTPHLNALAEQSFVFDNAYVTQPICTPARSSIMTGLYPHANGCIELNVPLRPETPTLAEMVSEDYICGYYGKWHLGDEIIPQHGFTDWVSIEDLYRRYYSKPENLAKFSTYHHYLVDNGFSPDIERQGERVFDRVTTARLPEEHVKARFTGREAARFIYERQDQPFVLYVGLFEPHNPYLGPLDDLYPPDELPVGPHFRRKPAADAALLHRMLADHYMDGGEMYGADLSTEAGCRRIRAQYMGNVTLIDRAVGDIMHALEECGLTDNTIVVFTSEHGDMMGDHGLFEKSVMYEEAARVPLLMHVPWINREQRSVPGRISQIDLVPTLLDLMGEPIPDGLQGESRAAVLRGEGSLVHNDVFIEWNGNDARPIRYFEHGVPPEEWQRVRGPWRTVVSAEGWKLNLSRTDQCELYDLNIDPYELTNRFNEPGQKERIVEMTARLPRVARTHRRRMNGIGQQVTPVAISIGIILLIAVLRSYSTTVAAVTATMPLTIPLSLWIVYAAEGGDRAVTLRFTEAMVFGGAATLVSIFALWQAARAGWGLGGMLAACYTAWAVVLSLSFVVRRLIH